MKTCQMYIDGAFIPNGDAQMIDIINPATEEVCAQIPYCTEEDVDKAVKAAYAAQDAWSKLPGIERQHYLEELVQLMRDHYDEFVDQLIEEQGKTVPGAQGEVSYAIDYFKYFAEFGRRIDGEIVQSDRPNERILLSKEPIGVAAGILPWNFPVLSIARKVAPALIAGNTVVIKPSTDTPLTCYLFAQLVDQSSLPKGVFNMVLGRGSRVGNALASHPLVGITSVTGGVSSGISIMGISGWKWLFICEGVPTILVGFFVYRFLVDKPSLATWLSVEERTWLQDELDQESKKVEKGNKKYSIWQAMFHPRVWLLAVTYLSLAIGLMGLNLWMPQIVKGIGNGLSNIQVGFIGAIPFLLAALGLIFIGRLATTPEKTKLIMGIAFIFGGICLMISGFTSSNLTLTMVLISICVVGGYVGQPLFWTITPTFLTGSAAAVGFAMVNSIGNLGGLFGPYFIGYVKDATGSFENSLTVLGGCIILCGVLALYAFTKAQQSLKKANEDNGKEAKAAKEAHAARRRKAIIVKKG